MLLCITVQIRCISGDLLKKHITESQTGHQVGFVLRGCIKSCRFVCVVVTEGGTKLQTHTHTHTLTGINVAYFQVIIPVTMLI